ncbi:hypothetical protein CVCC1112_3652 [Paenarthrobacter nicotinovorans]|nr:hypothetical protein ANMWB30_09360 [Arthrobacter sp. MWB30]GAT88993.1 hypothetical protein CVCC1112_3652 [Paenarthrobacter nicotinovorans]
MSVPASIGVKEITSPKLDLRPLVAGAGLFAGLLAFAAGQ